MKILISVFFFYVVFVGCFSQTGCAKITFKDQDYNLPVINFDGWDVFARLIGTVKKTEKKKMVLGSPYDLCFSFRTKSKVRGSVIITKIELHDTHENKVVYKRHNAIESKFKSAGRSDDEYTAFFEIKNLDLEYVRYMLVLEFKIETDVSVLEKEIKLFFEENYSEEKNSLFELLMSQ